MLQNLTVNQEASGPLSRQSCMASFGMHAYSQGVIPYARGWLEIRMIDESALGDYSVCARVVGATRASPISATGPSRTHVGDWGNKQRTDPTVIPYMRGGWKYLLELARVEVASHTYRWLGLSSEQNLFGTSRMR